MVFDLKFSKDLETIESGTRIWYNFKNEPIKTFSFGKGPNELHYTMYYINNEDWINKFTKHIDYFVNPAVYKKNYLIMDRFVKEMLIKLVESDSLFSDIKKSVEKLRGKCYALDHQQVNVNKKASPGKIKPTEQ